MIYNEVDEIQEEDLEAASDLFDRLKDGTHYTNDKECPHCKSLDVQTEWQWVFCNTCDEKWRLK